jgi:hypothetical protein
MSQKDANRTNAKKMITSSTKLAKITPLSKRKKTRLPWEERTQDAPIEVKNTAST